jgi:hypothetical protein
VSEEPTDSPKPETGLTDFDGTFEGTRRRQMLLGLEMTYEERLRWLDRTMAEMRRILGKAQEPTD